jgi:hypothetical protein
VVKIALGTARVLFVVLLLFCSSRILEDRYHGSFPPAGSFPYGAGNAPETVRSEILNILGRFQNGYVNRDSSALAPFMTTLFSRSNILILGTMPREIYVGFERASELVGADWESWGDCVFDLDNANISSHGEVAWFSTVGSVEFDLSSLLVLPLRISGVLVRQEEAWQFQHLQFQFDLDLSLVLLINILIATWLAVEVVGLAFIVFSRSRRKRQRA